MGDKMTRIHGRCEIAYGTEVVVHGSLVKDLMAAAENSGFTAQDYGKVDGTPDRRVGIGWKGKLDFIGQRTARKQINAFLDKWDAAPG